MDVKETLNQIKVLLGIPGAVTAPPPPAAPINPPVPEKLDAVTLKDGTAVSIDKLEIGGNVLINGVPPADGEYELNDGTNITVVNGVITEIESAKEEGAEPQDMKTPAGMMNALEKMAAPGAPAPDMTKVILLLKACFENVFGWQIREAQDKATRDAAIAAYQQGFVAEKKRIDDQNEALKKVLMIVEEIAKLPVAEPVSATENFREDRASKREARLESIVSAIKEQKKIS